MLYYDHFMYKVVKKMPESTHWLCVSYNSSKCKAAIKTSKEGALLLNVDHNHGPADRDPKKSVYSCVMQVSKKRRRSYGSLPNQRSNLSYSQTRRGKSCLIYEENIFYVNHCRKGGTFWVCSDYHKIKCRARCVTNAQGYLRRISGTHNHPPHSDRIKTNYLGSQECVVEEWK
ncbi:flywch zinc finger domain [Holotrichia oblita]|uniref:Flywch zinc finger domain n=1 Tax=Holotrichia oblita TaxID=644536 RepID=A0ACB9SU90_HOLOL|nr:flywch zinc finger domain [Holotrichia oblita]